jgi:hypothetical protein
VPGGRGADALATTDAVAAGIAVAVATSIAIAAGATTATATGSSTSATTTTTASAAPSCEGIASECESKGEGSNDRQDAHVQVLWRGRRHREKTQGLTRGCWSEPTSPRPRRPPP